ncbi:hypothetical protein Trydic_g21692 [Trypoxylus dichotomus]
MAWGCISAPGLGDLIRIEGRLMGEHDYDILKECYVSSVTLNWGNYIRARQFSLILFLLFSGLLLLVWNGDNFKNHVIQRNIDFLCC